MGGGKCQLEDLYASEDEADEPTDETVDPTEPTDETVVPAGEAGEIQSNAAEKRKNQPAIKQSDDDDDEEDEDDDDETTFAGLKFKEQEYQENLKKLEEALEDVKNVVSNKNEL